MTADHVALSREIAFLRELAAKKVEEDRLPAGLEATRRIRQEIAELDLDSNAVDLETKGYTVLAPGKAAPLDFCERLKEKILETDRRQRPKADGDGSPRGRLLWHLLPTDRLFEQALMAPAPLALVAFLLGYRAKLSQCTAAVKDESSTEPFDFHADQSRKVPAPWPTDAQFCTVTWALTDYTRENGALCVLPGSHKLSMDVPASHLRLHDHPDVEVVEAPAGSVIIHHGALWHGAVPRTAAGARVTLMLPMVRFHLLPQELFWASTTPDMIERNTSRFCALMGLLGSWPWGADGPDSGYTRPSWLTTREENRFG
ncbi:phytanoyl-CoA dioxygenase family protein [Streptomyces sp. NPDC058459]|uniref:phytanoyl-CoA dioxygenase family protein n=1 Tax=Streptomyces sp. NPDC058459 TaxID=3346508 RepID=UPI00366709AE